MGSSTRYCFLLLLAVAAVTARPDLLEPPPPGPENLRGRNLPLGDVALEEPAVLGTLFGNKPDVDCKSYCNGGELPSSDPYACVGTFKLFCQASGNKTFGVYALKCEGQFTTVSKDEIKFATCEGLFGNYGKGAKMVEGKVVKKLLLSGCLGTSSAIRKAPDTDDDALPLAATVWDSTEESDMSNEVLELREDSNTTSMLVETRCKGAGGKFKALKISDADLAATAASASFDELEAEVMGALKETGLSIDSMPSTLSAATPADILGDGPKRPDCKVTCNGKRYWGLAGILPCMGKLEVSCRTGGGHDHHGPDGDDAHSVLQLPGEMQANSVAPVDRHGPKVKFQASCQGFWSGVIGKKCIGFTKEHGKKCHKESWNFCSGRHALSVKKGPFGIGMGSFCKGKALSVANVTMPSDK